MGAHCEILGEIDFVGKALHYIYHRFNHKHSLPFVPAKRQLITHNCDPTILFQRIRTQLSALQNADINTARNTVAEIL